MTLPPRWEQFLGSFVGAHCYGEARTVLLRVLAEHDAERAGAQHHYVCDECGRHVSVDEDGCCVQCGEGCALEPCSCDAERAGPNDSTHQEETWTESATAVTTKRTSTEATMNTPDRQPATSTGVIASPSSRTPMPTTTEPSEPLPAEQPAPTCRCGSGAHPRRCQVHPNGYAEHCAELSAEYAAEEQAATTRETMHCLTCGGPCNGPCEEGDEQFEQAAQAAPDVGRLSRRIETLDSKVLVLTDELNKAWAERDKWRGEYADAEARRMETGGELSSKLAAAEERLETALTHASRAERVAEDRKTKLAAAERERDEAVAKERDRIMEIVETYEPRRDVPSDWTFQGALARVSEEIDPRTDPAPTE